MLWVDVMERILHNFDTAMIRGLVKASKRYFKTKRDRHQWIRNTYQLKIRGKHITSQERIGTWKPS